MNIDALEDEYMGEMYATFLILSSLAQNDGGLNMMFGGNKKEELHSVQKYTERDIFLPLGIYNIMRA